MFWKHVIERQITPAEPEILELHREIKGIMASLQLNISEAQIT